jgi:hypothetical protein
MNLIVIIEFLADSIDFEGSKKCLNLCRSVITYIWDVQGPSVTCLPIKDTNKHFSSNLGDTNDIMFSLTDLLDFNLITNYLFKSHVLSCANGTILDITFKFIAGYNMRLIFDCFYVPRKKRRLPTYLDLMCEQGLPVSFHIKYLYIDFFFFFLLFFFFFKHFSFPFLLFFLLLL